MSSSATKAAIRKATALYEQTVEFNATHPPITRMSPMTADNQREFTPVGEKCVACNLACYGKSIPKEYGRTKQIVNVFDLGIKVATHEVTDEFPEWGESAYFGMTCRFYPDRVCVTVDQKLRRSVER